MEERLRFVAPGGRAVYPYCAADAGIQSSFAGLTSKSGYAGIRLLGECHG